MTNFNHIGIVGAGHLGRMLTKFFAEGGLDISLWDIDKANIDKVLEAAKEKPLEANILAFLDIRTFMDSLPKSSPSLLVFTITQGEPIDSVIEKFQSYWRKGDIVLDCSNENYRVTDRRQKQLKEQGIIWIGMGISGGYQATRQGPSMSLGGDKATIDSLLPLLRNFAAQNPETQEPCVAYMGPGGAGHYVKMVHNAIEEGMLSTMSEAWGLLRTCLGLTYDEIGSLFELWNGETTLKNTFLIEIGAEVCRRKRKKPTAGGGGGGGGGGDDVDDDYMLDDIIDKVDRDANDPESIPYLSVMDAANRHIPFPTIASGHFLRVASSHRSQRVRVSEKLHVSPPQKVELSSQDRALFVQALHGAVYVSFLCSFIQGLELIARASRDEKWDINLGTCLRVWRAGCIIQEDQIANILQPILSNPPPDTNIMNLKLIDEVSGELHKYYEPLKQVVLSGTQWDAYIPSMSASLDYLRYEGAKELPTQFMAAQLDYFGKRKQSQLGIPK
ncbi:6-phosphogluconate dehydrogenase (decarboxylating) [Polytolypa hystricis UAMH7299]|uniref:phosphogluconate dehydrogenase (NADP(+)-dependent, decarboxylating) n=1 Tax=Polytolypa hystricis (strain UAMH7299) TaxID=1447883 RepID=A0A2B7XWD3_POLH7|nr:6-phosphogluconate dehydrogenase (decarboxylating) [Polytolypa hystricis UAMH7299]